MQTVQHFEFTNKYKIPAIVLIAVGALAIILGFASGDLARSWASLLLGNYFFMVIALAATFFLAIQYVAEVGWSVVIKRVLMSFGSYLIPSTILMILIFVFGHHHLYHWTHEGLNDPIIDGKRGYLNIPFYLIRLIAYAVIWSGFAFLMRKWSLQEDEIGGLSQYNKMSKYSAIFLVLYGVTSSTSAWDIIMSIDAHWFSTLFGWYTFASLFVTGLSVIALVVIHLKRKGYLPYVNENHIHDIGKFMFAFSVFWTYLYFSQFMLYWYANLPEEVTYFIFRQDHYKPIFIGLFFINFLAPFLILMTRGAKRKENTVVVVAVIIIIGHWLDFFMMIMPGTVGEHWHFGITEVGTSLFFLGLFMYVLFTTLSKTPLVPKNHPMLEESIHFHV
jgi:hypothetical protein